MACNSFGIANSANNSLSYHPFGETTKVEFAKSRTVDLRSFGIDSNTSEVEYAASVVDSRAMENAAEYSLHLLGNLDGAGI